MATDAILLATFGLMLPILIYGLLTMFAVYERVGHGGLAMDAGWEEDVEQLVRESWVRR